MSRVKSVLVGLVLAAITLFGWEVGAAVQRHLLDDKAPPSTMAGSVVP